MLGSMKGLEDSGGILCNGINSEFLHSLGREGAVGTSEPSTSGSNPLTIVFGVGMSIGNCHHPDL